MKYVKTAGFKWTVSLPRIRRFISPGVETLDVASGTHVDFLFKKRQFETTFNYTI